jgi:hypothetical protein
MKKLFALTAAFLLIGSISAWADGFRHPAPEIEKLTMASPLPSTNFSPDYSKAIMAFRANRHVPIAELAASEARIGGIRLDPLNFSETRENWFDDLKILDVSAVDGLLRSSVEGYGRSCREIEACTEEEARMRRLVVA